MSQQWSSQEPSTWEGSSQTSSTSETAKAEASNLAQTSKESVGHVAETAREQGQQVLSEATNQARNLLGEATSQVGQQAGEQQQRAASALRSVGEDLRSMADTSFRPSGPAAQLVKQASDQVQQVAGWLDSRDFGGMLQDVREFARRKPGTFLVGAAVAGLVVGRATRAGIDIKRSETSTGDEYATDYGYGGTTSTTSSVTESQYPYDTTDVGGTYAGGTYAGDTYTGDTYTGDTYTGGGTSETAWSDPGEPQR